VNCKQDQTIPSGDRPRTWSGRPRFRRAVVIGAVVAICLVVAAGVAFAQYAQNYSYGSHNNCLYEGFSMYDTTGSPKSLTRTTTYGCGSLVYATSCIRLGDGSYTCAGSGWYSPPYVEVFQTNTVTTSVYGYHQIQHPSGNWSPTIETHAQ
jgi:hypothetical protein